MAFVTERLNGEDGLGGIFPAMANALMMFDASAIRAIIPDLRGGRRPLRKLLVVDGEAAYCQPCVSPVWDTALACHALMEVGEPAPTCAIRRGLLTGSRSDRCSTP